MKGFVLVSEGVGLVGLGGVFFGSRSSVVMVQELSVAVPLNGQSKTVKFVFDPEKDTAEATALEIAAELSLGAEQARLIALEIYEQLGEKDVKLRAVKSKGTVYRKEFSFGTDPGAEVDLDSDGGGGGGDGGSRAVSPKMGSSSSLTVYKKGEITVVEVTDEPKVEDEANGAEEMESEEDVAWKHQLIDVSAKGNLAMVQSCISSGVDVNFSDYDGRTALHLAATENHSDVVRYLLNCGAKFNLRDRYEQRSSLPSLFSPPLKEKKHQHRKSFRCLVVLDIILHFSSLLRGVGGDRFES